MKKKISVAIDEELFEWIEKQVQERRFASVSHAVNYCVNKVETMENPKA